MAGKIDFGDDGDIPFFGIFHDISDFVLRIESAVWRAVIFSRIFPDDGFFSKGTDFGKFGKFLDFDSPTLVVGEMPMKSVDVMQSQHIDEFFYKINRLEMTGNIEHHSTIPESGLVIDNNLRIGYRNVFTYGCCFS